MLIAGNRAANLPPGALTPMTASVGAQYHLPEVVENILRLLPEHEDHRRGHWRVAAGAVLAEGGGT